MDRYTLSIEKWKDREAEVILHDNVTDPFQLENIAPKNEELVKELMESELAPWLERTQDPWLDG